MRQVYLASSFDLSDRVQGVCDVLVEVGYEVPDRWWNNDLKEIDVPDDEWYEREEVVDVSERHWQNIRESDVFVLVCPRDEPKKYNGANVEFGFAYANGCDCYSVGKLERSAMYEPITRCENLSQLVSELE